MGLQHFPHKEILRELYRELYGCPIVHQGVSVSETRLERGMVMAQAFSTFVPSVGSLLETSSKEPDMYLWIILAARA